MRLQGAAARWHDGVLGAFAAMCPLIGMLSARGMPILLVSGVLALLVTARLWPSWTGGGTLGVVGSLVLLAFLSLLWSVAPDVSLVQSLQLVGVAIPGVLLIGIMNDDARPSRPGRPGRLERAMLWLPIGVVVALAILLIDLLGDYPIYRVLNLLPAGQEVEAYIHNKAATALAVLLFPALLVLRRASVVASGRNGLQIALASAGGAGVLVTPSESAIVAVAGGLAILLAARTGEATVRKCLVGATIGAALLSPLVAVILPATSGDAPGFLAYSAEQRIEIWRYVGDLILEHPLLGIGIDGARHAMAIAEGSIEGSLHPHNFFLQIWLELGLPGMVWLTATVLFVGSRIDRLPVESRPYADAALAAAILVSCFAWGFWQTWWLATLMVAAAMFAGMAESPDER